MRAFVGQYLMVACLFCAAATGADRRQQELLQTETEWLNAYTDGNAAAMDRIEAEEFTMVYPDGSVVNKAQEIANLKQPGNVNPTMRLTVTERTVTFYGDMAVLNGIFTQSGIYQDGPHKGQPFKFSSRYLDVWVHRDKRWQVVASQLTRIP